MKKQKKQFLILVIALIVVLVGGLSVLKYLDYKEQKEAAELEASTIYVTKLDPEEIESFVCWYNADGANEDREFVKKDGKWIAMQDPTVELQQSWMNKMVNALAQIVAVEKLEGVVDLSQFGFDDAYKKYTIKTADETYELVLGSFNDLTDCYYLYETSDPTVVYSFEPGFVTGFVSSVDALAVVEEE